MDGINIDEKIRDYFLGRLSEAESERFEEELALDEGLFADAGTVERELIDDYIRESLSATDSDAFETSYLSSDVRRKRLAMAQALWQVAKDERSTERAFERTSGWLPQRWWLLVGTCATAALLMFVLYAGFIPVFVEVGVDKTTNVNPGDEGLKIMTGPERTSASPEASVVPAGSPDNSAVAVQIPFSPTPTPGGKVVSIVAAYTLVPGAMRDEGEQSINVSSKAKTVVFNLEKAKGSADYPLYSATIKTADGQTVLTVSRLRSLSLQLPAKRLGNRTYILFLEGVRSDGSAESVAEYTFRVRR